MKIQAVRFVLAILLMISLCFPNLSMAYTQWKTTAPDGTTLKHKIKDGLFNFYINSHTFGLLTIDFSLDFENPHLIALFAASEWAERAGSDLEVNYLGDTSRYCTYRNDGFSVIGIDPNLSFVKLAETTLDYNHNTGEIRSADICLATRSKFRTDTRKAHLVVDLRWVLAHEIGHAIGFDHDDNYNGIMRTEANDKLYYQGLFSDDKEGVRDIYGIEGAFMISRIHADEPNSNSWSKPYLEGPLAPTSLPFAVAHMYDTGDNDYKYILARVSKSRRVISLNKADWSLEEISWSSNPRRITLPNEDTVEHPVSIASNGKTASSQALLAYPGYVKGGGECSGVHIINIKDDWINGPMEQHFHDDICTNRAVSISYDSLNDVFFLAWSSREDGYINVRRSSKGPHYSFDLSNSDVKQSRGSVSLAAPSISCNDSGICGLSYIDYNEFQYDKETTVFEMNGDIIISSQTTSSSNWVYDSPTLYKRERFDGYDETGKILHFSASDSTGLSHLFTSEDSDYPVGGSYEYLNSVSKFPATVVSGHRLWQPRIFYANVSQ